MNAEQCAYSNTKYVKLWMRNEKEGRVCGIQRENGPTSECSRF